MESFENVLSVVSGQTLMELTLPPQDYVIRGLLPMGLSIIGGAPKIGKSWLMLDLCVKVAKGEPLWEMETRQGTILYLCLEDTLRRLQTRLDCITETVPPNAFFATVSGTLADDLEAQILQFIREHIRLHDVNIENEEDRVRMAKFHSEWSKKLYDVIVPYLREKYMN